VPASRRRIFPALLACAGLLAAGCAPADPLAVVVTADTAGAFATWRIGVGSDFTRDGWREFDDAVQEIKFEIMAANLATGGEAVATVARGRIDGLAAREVLRLGYTAKIRRLGADRAGLAAAMEQNSRLTTRADDTASIARLAEVRRKQEARLLQFDADIAAATRRRTALGPAPSASAPAP
jgi:hypothetical protein